MVWVIEKKSGFKSGSIPVLRYVSSWGAHRDAHLAKMSGDKTETRELPRDFWSTGRVISKSRRNMKILMVRRETLGSIDQQQGWHDPARQPGGTGGSAWTWQHGPPVGTPSSEEKVNILKTGVHGYLHLVCLSQTAASAALHTFHFQG